MANALQTMQIELNIKTCQLLQNNVTFLIVENTFLDKPNAYHTKPMDPQPTT